MPARRRGKNIETYVDGRNRKDIRPGQQVAIVLKKDQRTGKSTVGVVKDILTSSAYHSRGIKVRLEDGQIGGSGRSLPISSRRRNQTEAAISLECWDQKKLLLLKVMRD